jgi:hypothetical protein
MFVASPDKDIGRVAKRMPGHTTDKRGGLRQRGSKKVQTAPGGRVAVVQLPANVALLAPASFCAIAPGRFAIWRQAGYKESLIWMFRCLYAHEVKCKQHNNKVGSLSAP